MNLSISTIIEMDKRSVAPDATNGLSQLFSYVDPDELKASIDMVVMSTSSDNAEVRQEEFNCDETYLVLIPGLEGHYSKFKALCERLKLPAVVLQPGFDHAGETVEKTADRLVKVFLKKIKPKKKFYLLGYSFGVLVALEMASILEHQGLVGVVYCVDASPDTFPTALESFLGPRSGWQDAITQHMYTLMTGNTSGKLAVKLREAPTWKEKVDVCVNALRGHVPHSSHYARDVIEAAYGRIEQARLYDGSRLLASPLGSALVVLRSCCQPTVAPRDLGLSRYSRHAPAVYTLQAGHAAALTDPRAPNYINRHLDEEIQKTFLKKNLCERYLLSSSTFVAECQDLPDVY